MLKHKPSYTLDRPTKLVIELKYRDVFVHKYKNSHHKLLSSFKRIKHLCEYIEKRDGYYLPKQFIQLPLKGINNEID